MSHQITQKTLQQTHSRLAPQENLQGFMSLGVDYTGTGRKFQPFVENCTNTHQTVALVAFLSAGEDKMTVCVEHALGGIFEGTFERVSDEVVKYRKADGNFVFFQILNL